MEEVKIMEEIRNTKVAGRESPLMNALSEVHHMVTAAHELMGGLESVLSTVAHPQGPEKEVDRQPQSREAKCASLERLDNIAEDLKGLAARIKRSTETCRA